MKDELMDLLKFRTFITHQIVKILFWVLVAVSLLSIPILSIAALATKGFVALLVTGVTTTIMAALVILLGRVYAEMIVVIFGIHDELKHANEREDWKNSD